MSTHRPSSRVRAAVSPGPRPDWLEYEEFPFAPRYVDVDGNRVGYVDEGRGPTLLFVHAGPAWSFVFRDVVSLLVPDYRCVAIDPPGSGLSAASPTYEPTIESASRVLESALDEIGIETATLVVHDVGGPVALGVAARRPSLVRGLVVMGSFGWPLVPAFPGVARFIRLASGVPLRFLAADLGLLVRLSSTRFGAGRRLSPAGRRVFRAPFGTRRRRRIGIAMLRSALESDAILAGIERALETDLADRPALLLFGEGDASRTAGFQGKWEVLYPTARSEVVPGANHFPMADAPHAVSETIDEWFRESVADRSE